jgi:hypothetical protein
MHRRALRNRPAGHDFCDTTLQAVANHAAGALLALPDKVWGKEAFAPYAGGSSVPTALSPNPTAIECIF